MKNEYSSQEVVSLILNFHTFMLGYWADEIDECTELQKFIQEGYTYNDEEHPDLIKATEDGYVFLHCKISEISHKYIDFMLEKGAVCSKEVVAEWFHKEFDLCDIETAEDIAKYISCNLYHYGYKTLGLYSKRRGERYQIIKM